MRILIVGSGGREHAMAWKISRSPLAEKVFVAPGNGGTASCAENVPIKDNDIDALLAFCREKKIDLVAVGPELPLTLGLADALQKAGIACFGPCAAAARLEGSKIFAKEAMRRAGVPTADFLTFDNAEKALAYLQEARLPLVVKADGLAAGKGVIVAKSRAEAIKAVEDMLIKDKFGPAGRKIIIEEALSGQEVSFLAFSDGRNVKILPTSQDHKAAYDNDQGPNTGGMGAYSPAPEKLIAERDYEKTADLVIRPLIKYLQEQGSPFVGVLYAGLMCTSEGIKVLEYNVRFGDPECQPLLMRLESDLLEIMLACTRGRLDQVEVVAKPQAAICVVMAAEGYPGDYPKGMPIKGLEAAQALDGVMVFQAGAAVKDGRLVTSGGRVLGVTALGADLAAAKDLAYRAAEKITFAHQYYRRDIGRKGLLS